MSEPSDDGGGQGAASATERQLRGDDGQEIYALSWQATAEPRAIVAIAHGMGEHIGRYAAVAAALSAAGYAVYGKDHRGHGRTADPSALGNMGEDGWNRNLADMRNLLELASNDHPELPVVLLGHSMGAMLAQQFAYRYGYLLDGLALSGSPGFGQPARGLLSLALAKAESLRLGSDSDSELMQSMLFGRSNDDFDGPQATGFEWLSRDREAVARYVEDDFCGFVLSSGSLVALFNGAREASRVTNVRIIPKKLPIYVFSGSADPVHAGTANLERMLKLYRDAGLQPEYRLYQDGRHELFNETNRDEVLGDLIDWLDRITAA